MVDRKARSDPEGIDDVVPARICRVGMNEDIQATMVEQLAISAIGLGAATAVTSPIDMPSFGL
jgi:hypothetical protein